MLQEEPGEKNGEMGERGGEYVSKLAIQTWKNHGPIKILSLMKHTNVEVMQNLAYTQQNKDENVSIYGQSST